MQPTGILSVLFVFSGFLYGFGPASVSLTASPAHAMVGQQVTLSASVSPSSATGRVSFYDGITVLGTAQISHGSASLVTTLLPPGRQTLAAYYQGDGTDLPATSGGFVETITSVAGGGFQPASVFQSGSYSLPLAIGDFDEDGRPDIATAYEDVQGKQIQEAVVLLGNGDGSFRSGAGFAGSSAPTAFAVADFDGDGHMDLASLLPSEKVDILLGRGNGSFVNAGSFSTGIGDGVALAMVACDFNHDGYPDLAVANYLLQNQAHGLSVLLGKGDGTFAAPVYYNAGVFPDSLVAADFNGDGIADLAVADATGGAMQILLGVGDGTFLPKRSVSVHFPIFAASGDFNEDGKADLAVASLGPALGLNYSILLGNGDGTFGSPMTYSVPGPQTSTVSNTITVSDFNGDGHADLAFSGSGTSIGGSLTVLGGNGDGTFRLLSTNPTGNDALVVAAADFNGDGRVDVVAANGATHNLTVLLAAPPSSLQVSNGTLPQGMAGVPYSLTLSAIGGYPPYANWKITGGALPAQLALSPDGTISGTPATNVGSPFSFTVTVQDSAGVTSPPETVSLPVAAPVPAILIGGIDPVYRSSSLIAPGSWISIYGYNLATDTETWNGDYPTSLGNVTVTINGKQGYLSYVSPTQINLEAPDDTQTGPVSVVVTNSLGGTTSTVSLSPLGESLFMIGNYPAAVILTPDGSGAYGNGAYDLMGPVGAYSFPTRPVKQGETLVLYGTGFGPTNPPVPAGQPLANPVPLNSAAISIGGKAANVLYAGIVSPGVYQFNVVVPTTGSGTWPLLLSVSGPNFGISVSGPPILVQ